MTELNPKQFPCDGDYYITIEQSGGTENYCVLTNKSCIFFRDSECYMDIDVTCKKLKCVCFDCSGKIRSKCGICIGRICDPDCGGFMFCQAGLPQYNEGKY